LRINRLKKTRDEDKMKEELIIIPNEFTYKFLIEYDICGLYCGIEVYANGIKQWDWGYNRFISNSYQN